MANTIDFLTPNTQYSFRAKARNAVGTETAETVLVSTYTLAVASAPLAGTPLFAAVYQTSVTVNWSSGTAAGGFNGSGATYLVQASSYPDFHAIAGSSQTANTSATVPGLAANTTNYLRVRAHNFVGVTDYSYFVLGSTPTLAFPPAAAPESFLSVGLQSLTVAWLPNGNPVGLTTYTVVLSTGASFPNSYPGNVVLSTRAAGAAPSLVVTGLGRNTTYHLFVDALNMDGLSSGYTGLGSTATVVETPTGVVFDEISTNSITASAYAATPAFSNLDQGQSGTNLYGSSLGAYAGWRTGNAWVAKAAMPTARSQASSVALGGRLYVIGGTVSGPTLTYN